MKAMRIQSVLKYRTVETREGDRVIDNKNYMGKSIKERRNRLRMSQERLAEKANTTQAMISKIERGLNDPTFQLTCEIAQALECSPLDFCPPEMGFTSEYKLSSSDEALIMSVLLRKRDEHQ